MLLVNDDEDDELWSMGDDKAGQEYNPILAGPIQKTSRSSYGGGRSQHRNSAAAALLEKETQATSFSSSTSQSQRYVEEDEEQDSLPMHSAAFYGKFSVLSDLISKRGVNIGERDSAGNSLIHYAAEGGDRSLGCLALLLNLKGLDKNALNEKGQTPLHAAAARGFTNTMHALLLSGCKKDVQDKDGNTAMHISALSRYQVRVCGKMKMKILHVM